MDGLKAYTVQEEDEGTGGIVFAKSSAEARREGSSQFGDGDFNWGKARRASWADAYCPGPVPKLVMIDNGWWFECIGCGCTINSDCEDYGEGDEVRALKPVEYGDCIYCTEECREQYLRDRAAAKECETAAISELQAKLLTTVPGITLTQYTHAYAVKRDGAYIAQQVVIGFTFPGATIGDGNYRFDKIGEEPHVTVCAGDLPVWEAWRDQIAKAA